MAFPLQVLEVVPITVAPGHDAVPLHSPRSRQVRGGIVEASGGVPCARRMALRSTPFSDVSDDSPTIQTPVWLALQFWISSGCPASRMAVKCLVLPVTMGKP